MVTVHTYVDALEKVSIAGVSSIGAQWTTRAFTWSSTSPSLPRPKSSFLPSPLMLPTIFYSLLLYWTSTFLRLDSIRVRILGRTDCFWISHSKMRRVSKETWNTKGKRPFIHDCECSDLFQIDFLLPEMSKKLLKIFPLKIFSLMFNERKSILLKNY